MGQLYWVTRTGTPVAGQDFITLISATGRRIKLRRLTVGGGGTNAAQQLLISRATAGTTPGGAITPTPATDLTPASVFTTATTWSAQPTPVTNQEPANWNAAGGANINNAIAGSHEARNGDCLSIRCPSSGLWPKLRSSLPSRTAPKPKQW